MVGASLLIQRNRKPNANGFHTNRQTGVLHIYLAYLWRNSHLISKLIYTDVDKGPKCDLQLVCSVFRWTNEMPSSELLFSYESHDDLLSAPKFARHTHSALLSCKLKIYIEYLYKPSFLLCSHLEWTKFAACGQRNSFFCCFFLLQKVRKGIIELLLFELTNWIKSLELQSDHITNDVRTAHLNNSIW